MTAIEKARVAYLRDKKLHRKHKKGRGRNWTIVKIAWKPAR